MNFQAFGEAEYFAGRTEGLWNHAVVNCASPVSRQYAAFEYGTGANSKAINRFLYFGIQCKSPIVVLLLWIFSKRYASCVNPLKIKGASQHGIIPDAAIITIA